MTRYYYLSSLVLIPLLIQSMDDLTIPLLSKETSEGSYSTLTTTADTLSNLKLAPDLINEIMEYLPGSSAELQTLSRYFEPKPTTQKKILTAFQTYLENLPSYKKAEAIEGFFKTVKYEDWKNKLYHFFDNHHEIFQILPPLKQAIERADFPEFKRLCDSAKFSKTQDLTQSELMIAKLLIESIEYYEDSINLFRTPVLNQELSKKIICRDRLVTWCSASTTCAFLICLIWLVVVEAADLANNTGARSSFKGLDNNIGVIIATPSLAVATVLICLFWRHGCCCYQNQSKAMKNIHEYIEELKRSNDEAQTDSFVPLDQDLDV